MQSLTPLLSFTLFGLLAVAAPYDRRQTQVSNVVCTDPNTTLTSQDVNAAMLQICGGFTGTSEQCQGSPTSSTGQSGTALFSITPATEGATIDISKDSWEQCIEAVAAICGQDKPFTATFAIGASTGDINVELKQATSQATSQEPSQAASQEPSQATSQAGSQATSQAGSQAGSQAASPNRRATKGSTKPTVSKPAPAKPKATPAPAKSSAPVKVGQQKSSPNRRATKGSTKPAVSKPAPAKPKAKPAPAKSSAPVKVGQQKSSPDRRATQVSNVVCTDPNNTLASQDVNAAQLQICGGLTGTTQKCQGNPTSTTGKSGTAVFSIVPAVKGATLNISKSSWEQGIEAVAAKCGQDKPFTATFAFGASTGNINVALKHS